MYVVEEDVIGQTHGLNVNVEFLKDEIEIDRENRGERGFERDVHYELCNGKGCPCYIEGMMDKEFE